MQDKEPEAASAHAATTNSTARADQRLARSYRFADPDMDLFFMAALSWGPAGGLDIGQAFHIASTIKDGDADSWVNSFADYGEGQNALADSWLARGWRRAAGEARLKAFASYRSAWQFAAPASDTFAGLSANHQKAFYRAMDELRLPATAFEVPWKGHTLPGLFVRNADADAPVVLVIGGADTSLEDLFLSLGRGIWDRGYSVAIVDLPGQGNTAAHGLHWDTEPERPIAAVIDRLVQDFGAQPGRIALIGMSLGGYFVTRAAGHDSRLATVIASTPFPAPGQLFAASVRSAMASGHTPSAAALRSYQNIFFKAGVKTPQEFLERWEPARADPELVTLPFLSVLGGGDSPMFAAQAREWHERIRSKRKEFVFLDAATGADGHCQVNARLRMVQEACGWMDDIFASAEAAGRVSTSAGASSDPLATVNRKILAPGESLPAVQLKDGTRVQTGTVATMLHNVSQYNGGARGEVERELELAIPTLAKVGLFDLFPPSDWIAGTNAGRRFVGEKANELLERSRRTASATTESASPSPVSS